MSVNIVIFHTIMVQHALMNVQVLVLNVVFVKMVLSALETARIFLVDMADLNVRLVRQVFMDRNASLSAVSLARAMDIVSMVWTVLVVSHAMMDLS